MLLKNKLCAPRGGVGVLELDRPARRTLRRLTLIQAPAGYGKTTYAQQVLEQQPGAHLWFSIDPLDNDPIRFWTHFIGAFQSDFGAATKDALSLLAGAEQYSVEDILNSFFMELSATDNTAVLVLDDFHHITNKSVLQTLNYFIDYAPASVSLIITSRTRPELRLDTRLLNGQAEEIGAEFLAFQAGDIQEFFRQMYGVTPTDSQIAAVQQKTEGWISAIKLMFFSAPFQSMDKVLAAGGAGSNLQLYQYLLEEVLNGLTPELSRFIQAAALFERFTPGMMDQVCAAQNSFSLISLLLTKNLFIHRLHGDSDWFRFHDLFKSCVLQTSALPLDEQQALRRAGAHWLESANDIFEALNCFSRNADWQDVARLIEQHGRRWLREGHSETLSHYLSLLPPAVWQNSPLLICLRVWGMRDSDKHKEGGALLNQALSLQQAGGNEDHALLCEIYTLKAIIERLKSNWPETLSATTLALQHADAGDIDMRWRSYTTLGAYEYIRGNLKEAKAHLLNGVKYAAIEQHRYGLAHSAGYLSEVLFQLGELQEALHIARHVCKELENTAFGKLRIGIWRYVAMPDLLREQGEFIRTEEILEQMIPVFQTEETEVLPKLLVMLRHWSLRFSQYRYSDALAILDDIESTELMMRFASPFASGSIAGLRARIKLAEGDLRYAVNWRNTQNFSVDFMLFGQHPDLLTFIRIYIANAEYDVAADWIRACLQRARQQGWKVVEAKLAMLAAANAFATGDKAGAKKALQASLELLYGAGYRCLYTDEWPWLKEMFEWAQSQPGLSNYSALFTASALEGDDSEEGCGLSKREVQLLQCILKGMSDKEISTELCISTGTVKTHLRNIFRKLGAKNRAHALAIYSNLRQAN